jgi:cyclic-di-AMP phosphodiesterase PgpH
MGRGSTGNPSLLGKNLGQWLQAGKMGWRLILALVFMSSLCLFLQIREAKVDVLELHSTSKQYVVAQADFEFFDEEKTFFLQQQAMRDVGAVYQLDGKILHKVGLEFEEYLIRNQSWRKTMPKVGFEQIYEYSEAVEEFLVESRFSDERTVAKMLASELVPSHSVFVLQEGEGAEFFLPDDYWVTLQQYVFPNTSDSSLVSFVVEFFKQRKWLLQKDVGLEKKLKLIAKESVAPQYGVIHAGTFILEPGEKVTLKHVMLVQSMKDAMGEVGSNASLLTVLGSFSLSFIITFLSSVYLRLYHKEIFYSIRRLTLLVSIILLTLIVAKITEYILIYKGYNLIEAVRFPLVVPFASLLLCVLLGARIALFISIFLSIIISLGLAIEYDRFLILNLIASMCAIIFSRTLHRRKDIFEVCGKVWLCCLPVLLAFHLKESSFCEITLIIDLAAAFGFMTVTAVIVVGLLPLFETIFNVTTDMTLMEYMDPNTELLRRLSLEAPGTYQHSLVVGNLAEYAARSIGANDLFCRVVSLYHDIGKLFNPHYFTENQLGGFNIHQLLTPLESTHVIISHIPEGEILARKHHLPKSFIDVIREHHGTTLVYFFYCKQIEQMDGDPAKVNEKLFRYPGPKPHTKEAALIMIADTIEAASRSLDEVTEETATLMVDRLISEKAQEGQFDECSLTFQELGTIKKSIVKALLVTRHLRIKYPEKL